MPHEVVLWDLDNTLRRGMAGWDVIKPPSEISIGTRLNILVSNNAADDSITLEQIHAVGLTFIDRIWTPRVLMHELVHRPDSRPNDIFVCRVPAKFLEFVELAYLVSSQDQPGRIFCTEPESILTSPNEMFEAYAPTARGRHRDATIWLPDVGACAAWLCKNARGNRWANDEFAQIIDIGKSSTLGVESIRNIVGELSGLVVGDSDTDKLLAEKMGYSFYRVQHNLDTEALAVT